MLRFYVGETQAAMITELKRDGDFSSNIAGKFHNIHP